MTTNVRSFTASLCASLLIMAASPLSHALRCGGYVIANDIHISEVVDKCGEPDSEINKKEYITTYISDNRESQHVSGSSERSVGREVTREIQVTEFIYNFGAERFKRKLRFVDGHLNRVTQLNRGSSR